MLFFGTVWEYYGNVLGISWERLEMVIYGLGMTGNWFYDDKKALWDCLGLGFYSGNGNLGTSGMN